MSRRPFFILILALAVCAPSCSDAAPSRPGPVAAAIAHLLDSYREASATQVVSLLGRPADSEAVEDLLPVDGGLSDLLPSLRQECLDAGDFRVWTNVTVFEVPAVVGVLFEGETLTHVVVRFSRSGAERERGFRARLLNRLHREFGEPNDDQGYLEWTPDGGVIRLEAFRTQELKEGPVFAYSQVGHIVVAFEKRASLAVEPGS